MLCLKEIDNKLTVPHKAVRVCSMGTLKRGRTIETIKVIFSFKLRNER